MIKCSEYANKSHLHLKVDKSFFKDKTVILISINCKAFLHHENDSAKSYEPLKWINQKQSIGAIYIILRKMRRKRGMDKV